MILLVKLLLAHLIGDFLLQPKGWVKAKEEKKLNSWQLYVHALVHGLLIMLLVWDLSFFKWALLLMALHLVIDIIKLYLQTGKTGRFYFFADQAAHLLAILLVYFWYEGFPDYAYGSLLNERNLILVTILFFLTFPSSIIVKIFITRWSPGDNKEGSLAEAGKYIGIIERLLVFIFITTGHWEAIGFLIAAKSVFRFGGIRESDEKMISEYILIGTLASFGIAILSGLAYSFYLDKI